MEYEMGTLNKVKILIHGVVSEKKAILQTKIILNHLNYYFFEQAFY